LNVRKCIGNIFQMLQKKLNSQHFSHVNKDVNW